MNHDTFMSAEDLLRAQGVETIVMNGSRCIELMRNFIESKPHLWFEDIGTIDQDHV